jgi:HlyD family secretion protein
MRDLRGRGVSTQRELDAAVRDFDEIQIRLRTNQSDRAKLISATLDTDEKAQKEQDQITESLLNFRNQLATVEKEDSERSTRRREELFAKRQALNAAEDKLKLLQARLEREGKVESPLTSYVVEILVEQGQVIQAGTPVVSVHDQDRPLGVTVYIPAADGQKVESGMRLEITPVAVKREEFGFIVGNVGSAGTFPVTENAMTRLLQNKLLVQDLVKKGPAVEVLGSLQSDADAPSGYHWSSGLGPPIAIRHGMLCNCSVIVREQRPITLVIPTLRKFFGIK